MSFAVSSDRLTVRVSTRQQAIAWANKLKRHASGNVAITIAASGVRCSEKEFKTALEGGQVHGGSLKQLTGNASRIDPIFQAH
jgi:hypothetical protein